MRIRFNFIDRSSQLYSYTKSLDEATRVLVQLIANTIYAYADIYLQFHI